MFAILLSDKMNPFYENIASFPTVVFTFLLVLCTLYWLTAILGLVSVDMLDFDLPEMAGLEDLNADVDSTNPDVLAGLMLRYGLHGVPVTIIVSLLAMIGWIVCYYLVHFGFSYTPDWISDSFVRYLVGIPIFLVSLYLAVLATAVLIKPLRPFFLRATQETTKYVIGQTAVVRTSRVDNGFGEALLDDGGAGLILKVRCTDGETFEKGDRVVLIDQIEGTDFYRVISEAEFTDS
ncbi:MAG: NfeD family protein [Pseudomonadota bacterium]